jgi:putative FmdB family regulatory protein
MPILKYRCTVCGKEFAKIFFKPENSPRQCPVCAAPLPQEIGPAFDHDLRSSNKLVCGTCQACEEQASCPTAPFFSG